jgi:hypothetical protein
LFAAIAIATRLPFLVTGKIPFDSDEAVEGLMARHVLYGEMAAFMWGQSYKGVPEVYASAGAFALFEPTVLVLKSVTLAFFAAFVALNFMLLDKIASRWMAVSASLLLALAPPSFVLWTLSASAEYVLIMLLGTILLLVCLQLEDPQGLGAVEPHRRRLMAALGFTAGLGLWVHQLFVVYLFPVALILTLRTDWWKRRARSRPGRIVLGLAAIASLYAGLGVIAFVTGGFRIQLGAIAISATAPQKLIRIAAGIAVLAILTHMLTTATAAKAREAGARYWPLAVGCCAGYLPALLYSVFVEPARSPARVATLAQLAAAAPDMLGNIIPILAGFKLATTERLALPIVAALPGAAALAAYLWMNRRRIAGLVTLSATDPSIARDFFPVFVLFLPVLFLFSGVYVDTQSYRYLIPTYAGVSVAWSAGALKLSKGRTRLAAAVIAAIATVHGAQQLMWYLKLVPDPEPRRIVECLKRDGIRGGTADYWTSYKLTFLAQEEIIIAPSTGVDRYPAYTQFVRSLPAHQTISLKPGSTYCAP